MLKGWGANHAGNFNREDCNKQVHWDFSLGVLKGLGRSIILAIACNFKSKDDDKQVDWDRSLNSLKQTCRR